MLAMKLGLVALAGFVCAIVAAPVEQSSPIAIVKDERDGPNPDGSYLYHFETENGINAREEGHLVQSDNAEEGDAMDVQGSFSYPGDDGTIYTITYTAGKDGFKPEGAHIPTSPPIPKEIMESLEYNAAHPEENNDGAQKR
ncbi:hypothetical protein PV326_004894 [Microctonus aethiopoides]|nr:hypothetical protein PV326_004894 [Microctonus aethiopoides]